MTLRACSQCHRHFRAETECPFCGAAAAPQQPRPFSTARISRAAAFAGAALTGCYTSTPPPQQPPPDQQQQQQQPPPPPPDDQFAKPPPPKSGPSSIEGTITDGAGQPLAVVVQLRSRNPAQPFRPRSVQSDASGRYAFVGLPPGAYTVSAGQGDPRRPPSQQQVQLAANDKQTVDLTVYPYVPSNLPTPYGAPPARTRIV